MMTIGIIGSDDRAVAIGRMLTKSGNLVCFSDLDAGLSSRSAAAFIGDRAFATTPYQQSAICDALCFAIKWDALERALSLLGTYKDGIVIDATRPPDLGQLSGAELLAHKLDNRHVVKAFVEPIEPNSFIKIASDDPEARAQVGNLIADAGGNPLDVGPLASARTIEHDVARVLHP